MKQVINFFYTDITIIYPHEYPVNNPMYPSYHMISMQISCCLRLRLSALNRSADCLKPTLLPPLILGGLAAKVAWHIVRVSRREKKLQKDVEPHYTDINKYLSIYDS